MKTSFLDKKNILHLNTDVPSACFDYSPFDPDVCRTLCLCICENCNLDISKDR